MDAPHRKDGDADNSDSLTSSSQTGSVERLPSRSGLTLTAPEGHNDGDEASEGVLGESSQVREDSSSSQLTFKTLKAPQPDFDDEGSMTTLERSSPTRPGFLVHKLPARLPRRRASYCSDDDDDDDDSSRSTFGKPSRTRARIPSRHRPWLPPRSRTSRTKSSGRQYHSRSAQTVQPSGYMEPIVVGGVHKVVGGVHKTTGRSPSHVRRKMRRMSFMEAVSSIFHRRDRRRSSMSSRKSLVQQFETRILGELTLVTRRDEYDGVFTAKRFHRLKPTQMPKHVFIVYLAAMVDRLSHISVRSLSVPYFADLTAHTQTQHTVKVAGHWFQLVLTLTGLLLCVVSDGMLGAFHSLLVFSLVCLLSTVLLLWSTRVTGTMAQLLLGIGLIFFMLGMGGYRAAYSALGATQFVMPEQAARLHTYYYFCHFCSCSGIFLAKVGTAQLRHTFSCDNAQCYAIGFAVVMAAHILVIVLLTCFRGKFAKYIPRRNLPVKVISCIFHAAQSRCHTTDSGEDWLESVRNRYGGLVVRDARIILELALVFLMSPIYWAVYYNATRLWHLFAQRSTGRLSETFEVMPEQLMAMVSGFALVTTPLIYNLGLPLLARFGFTQVPQRLVIGAFVCCLSYFFYFVMSLVVISKELKPTINIGTCDVRFYNPTMCEFSISSPEISLSTFWVRSMDYTTFRGVNWDTDLLYNFTLTTHQCRERYPSNGTFELKHRVPNAIYFSNGLIRTTKDVYPSDSIDRLPKFRFLTECKDRRLQEYRFVRGENVLKMSVNSTDWFSRTPGLYMLNDQHNTRLEMGGIYVFLVGVTQQGTMKVKECEINRANTLHVFWMLPSIFLMSCAEVMFLPSCLELGYKHGPPGLKMMALNMFLVTNGIGNVLDIFMRIVGVEEERFASTLFIVVMFVAAFLMLVINASFKFMHQYVASDEEYERMAEGYGGGGDATSEEEEDVLSLPSSETDRTMAQIIAHNQRLMAKRDEVRGTATTARRF